MASDDKRIKDLIPLTTSVNADELVIDDVSEPVETRTKKITKQNLLKELWENFNLYYTKIESDGRYSVLSHLHTGIYSPVAHLHTGIYDPAGSASGAVSAHNLAYDHTLIATALQEESDPIFTDWLDTDPLANFITEELDPVFNAWLLTNPFANYFNKTTDDTEDITDTANKRFTNDTDISRLADTSGENTGDQDISGKWNNDGSSTATGNWDIGNYSFKSGFLEVDATLGKGLLIAGQDVGLNPRDTEGVLFMLSNNTLSNRQMTFLASDDYGIYEMSGFRYILGFDVPAIDAVSADGSVIRNLIIGQSGSNVGIGFDVGWATQGDIIYNLQVGYKGSRFGTFGSEFAYVGGNSGDWYDLFSGQGSASIQPQDGSSAIVKIGGMEYSKDPGQAGISYMIQRENNTLDENGDPAAYGSILAFYSNGYGGAGSSINLGFDGHYFTAIAWDQGGMWGGQTGNTTIDNHAWGLFNGDGHAEFSYIHIGDTINGFLYPYDGYSGLQVDTSGSFRCSIGLRADTAYGGYGPSFDFNATESGGNNWRMVSTGNDDGIGPGWYNFYQDPYYSDPPLSFSPDRNVIVGPFDYGDTGHKLQVFGTAWIGDYGSGYSEFETDGSLKMVGTARVKNEIQISALSAANGASAPTSALRNIGASGGVKKAVSQFSKTTQQDVYFEFHGADSIDESVDVNFHMMWLPGAGWTTGNYMWKLEFLVKNENDAYNTGTPTTISANVTPTNATTMIETEFATGINLNPQQILIGHFYRDVANDNADNTGDVNFFEVEYTQNKLGTAL